MHKTCVAVTKKNKFLGYFRVACAVFWRVGW